MDVVDFARALYKELRERRATLSEHLVYGHMKSFEQYQNYVGQIQGLDYAENTLKALLENRTDGDSAEETLSS